MFFSSARGNTLWKIDEVFLCFLEELHRKLTLDINLTTIVNHVPVSRNLLSM